MFGIDFTFVWTAVNLVVIYLVLNKFLFKKLGSFMEKRSASIAADIEKGEALARERAEFQRGQEILTAKALGERKEILDEARRKASEDYDRIVQEAKKEAEHIVTAAKEGLERERERLFADVRQDVATLAVLAASKVIESNIDSNRNRALVERFINSEGSAILSEYRHLEDMWKKGLDIKVYTATPLDDSQIARISDKFRDRYGVLAGEVHAYVDPSVLGGIRVRVGDAYIDDTISARLKGLLSSMKAGA